MGSDFPSLRLGYEQIKDVLNQQEEIYRDYFNRAMTLFSVATAIIGIGVPLMFTKNAVGAYLMKPYIPLTTLSAFPVLIYAVIIYYTYCIFKMDVVVTMNHPTKVKDEFVQLDESQFYSDMIQHIESGFCNNERRIKQRAEYLSGLTLWVVIETVVVILLMAGFSAIA